MQRPLWIVLLLCTCLAGCARSGAATRPDEPVAPSEPTPSAQDEADRLLEAMKEELPPLPEHAFEAAGMRARVEAREPVVVQEQDGVWRVKVPLLEDEPITCIVQQDALRGAETLSSFVRTLSEGGELGVLGNTTVAVAGDRPVVFMEGLVRREQDGQMAFGHLKMMVAPTPPHSVGCYMLSVGYAKTFQRVMLGLVASIEPRGTPPTFTEIHEYRTADVVLGFEHRRVWRSPDHTERSEVMGVLLVPISETLMSWQDIGYAEVSDARGRLKSMTWFRNADNEKAELELQQRSPGTYEARGDVAGELVSGTVKSRDSKPILSELGRNRATRELLSGKSDGFEAEAYVPGFNPLAFLLERFVRHPDGTIESIAGSATVRGTYDAQTGTPLVITTDMGDGRMLVGKRVFVAGRP